MPNYCTHAIELFADLAKRLPARLGILPDFELLLHDLMVGAVKFALPVNGYIFNEPDFKPWMFDRQELQHPVYALEFAATTALHAAQSGLAHSPKRIALCFDPWQLPPEQLARLSRLGDDAFLEGAPRRCLAVMVVYEANGLWNAAVGAVLIDLDADRPVVLNNIPGAHPIRAVADRVGSRLQSATAPSAHALPATYRTFRARSALVGQSDAQAYEALYIDTLHEIGVAYEVLAALNSKQVSTYDVPAPAKLNAKRVRNGKAPFYPYKVLNL